MKRHPQHRPDLYLCGVLNVITIGPCLNRKTTLEPNFSHYHHWEICFPHPCEQLLLCVKTDTALGWQPTQVMRKEDLKTVFEISDVLCSFVLFQMTIISFGSLFFFPTLYLCFPIWSQRELVTYVHRQFSIWELLLYHYLTRNFLFRILLGPDFPVG